MNADINLADKLNAYPHSFLAYILNETIDSVSHRLEETSHSLGDLKESIIFELVKLEGILQELPEAQRSFERNSRLGQYQDNLGCSAAVHFRRLNALADSAPSSSDEVERLLMHCALVTYPMRLLDDETLDPLMMSARISWHDPLREQLQDAVMADPLLNKLFPDVSETTGPSGYALRSTGMGGSLQLWTFADDILVSGWHRAHFSSEHPTFEEFAASINVNLKLLRMSLRGKKSEVPMRIGLAGMLLPEGTNSIDFGWALVRRSDERDQHFTRRVPVEGQLQYTNSSGQNIMIDYVGNVVLEMDVPYKMLLGERSFSELWPDELDQFNLVAEPIECLRLALLLAGIEENSVAASTWQSVVDPLNSAESIGWNDPRQRTNLLPVQLSVDQIKLWKEWAVRIHDGRTSQTNVSIRRLLRAVSEQKEPEDTLIDAIVVWENLFGASQEATLRITASIAWILGDDAKSRQVLIKELKEIYQQRSDIVHGNASIKTKKTPACAKRAIEISIELLRVIFKEYPSILSLRTGAERSNIALVDALGTQTI